VNPYETMQSPAHEHVSTLRDYLSVLRRRAWVIVLAVVLVPAAAVVFSLRQETMYSSSAQVLLSQQDLSSELTGTLNSLSSIPADRRAQTQADLARVPDVARRAVRLSGLPVSAQTLLQDSSVSVPANADILTFSVSNHVPEVAQRLATAYATAYVRYRLAIDTAPIKTALGGVEDEIQAAVRGSALYTSLVDKATQLKTMAALKTANASVVRAAQDATQTAPKPVRNGILGLALGILLGIGLAFLYEALDTRVRTSDEVATRLGIPLLARLPEPPKKYRSSNRLAMLADPVGTQAEAFRVLRTNVQFASLGHEPRSIMVTSAIEEEGKSTTIANLAVACARAGQRVVLVELDLRRPMLDRFFDIDRGHPGVTHVALGESSLEEALVPIAVANPDPFARRSYPDGGNGNGGSAPMLHVLTAGAIPPDPGEFMASERLTSILGELRFRADLVLIDAPPILHVGDGLALSAQVDAVLVVTRLDTLRRGILNELQRLLGTTPTRKLGFVVTGGRNVEGDGYGYGYGYYPRRDVEGTFAPRSEPIAGHASEAD